jgi:hypothetical protein
MKGKRLYHKNNGDVNFFDDGPSSGRSLSAKCGRSWRFLLRPHAEQKARQPGAPDADVVQGQRDHQRGQADHDVLDEGIDLPLHHVEPDHDDGRLMQNIERQLGFFGVLGYAILERWLVCCYLDSDLDPITIRI